MPLALLNMIRLLPIRGRTRPCGSRSGEEIALSRTSFDFLVDPLRVSLQLLLNPQWVRQDFLLRPLRVLADRRHEPLLRSPTKPVPQLLGIGPNALLHWSERTGSYDPDTVGERERLVVLIGAAVHPANPIDLVRQGCPRILEPLQFLKQAPMQQHFFLVRPLGLRARVVDEVLEEGDLSFALEAIEQHWLQAASATEHVAHARSRRRLVACATWRLGLRRLASKTCAPHLCLRKRLAECKAPRPGDELPPRGW